MSLQILTFITSTIFHLIRILSTISYPPGISPSLKTWALRDGLMLCVNLNLLAVEIEVDAKVVLGWVTEEFNYILHHASLIINCRTLINRIPWVKTKHCFREANKCADLLVRKGLSTDQDLFILVVLLLL